MCASIESIIIMKKKDNNVVACGQAGKACCMNSVTNSVLLLVVRVIYCPGPVASAVDGIQGPAHHGSARIIRNMDITRTPENHV